MKYLQAITYITVLLASLMIIFGDTEFEVEFDNDEDRSVLLDRVLSDEKYDSLNYPLTEEKCSEAKYMASKYQAMSMNEANVNQQSIYESRMNAHATYYLAFCDK